MHALHLSANDQAFLRAALHLPDSAQGLLTDPETQPAMLAQPQLQAALFDQATPVHITPRLFFFLALLPQAQQARLTQEVTQHLAEMLAGFTTQAQLYATSNGQRLVYLFEYHLAALKHSRHAGHYYLHLGNLSLLLLGLFATYIEQRARRGFPSLEYYEATCQAAYHRVAVDPRLPETISATSGALCEQFHPAKETLRRTNLTRLHW